MFSLFLSDADCSKLAEAYALVCQKNLRPQVVNDEKNLETKQKPVEIATFDNI